MYYCLDNVALVTNWLVACTFSSETFFFLVVPFTTDMHCVSLGESEGLCITHLEISHFEAHTNTLISSNYEVFIQVQTVKERKK